MRKDANENPVSIEEAVRLVESLPPLPPRSIRCYKQRDQRGRWMEAGRRTQQLIFGREGREALEWLRFNRPYFSLSDAAEQAVLRLKEVEEGKHPMDLGQATRQVLARLVAGGELMPRDVVDFAIRYVEQELKAGRLLRIEPRG